MLSFGAFRFRVSNKNKNTLFYLFLFMFKLGVSKKTGKPIKPRKLGKK
jgi:hypothetical protein